MAFASANRSGLYRVKELVWGVTPANPALIPTRYTGEALDDNISTEKSQEIRDDRMTSDLILTDSSPSGSFNFEMSYGSFDDLLLAALMDDAWSASLAIVGVAGDISTVAAASDNLTSTTAGKFTNIAVGQWIMLSGFTNPALNRAYRVVSKTSNQSITLDPQPTAAETPAAAAANIDGEMIRNGVTEHSFTFVKQFNDATVVTRHIFRGMRVSGFSLEMATASILTGTFNLMGKSAVMEESTFAGETIAAASNTEVMNAVTNVLNVEQNGAGVGSPGAISTLSLELDNQHREQKGIGVLGNVGVVAGTLVVNLSASIYFESKEQFEMFKNSEAFAFSFTLMDNAGNGYVVTLPRCKYESFTSNSSQLDSDVMAEVQFTALRDPVTNCMIQIDRFAAA